MNTEYNSKESESKDALLQQQCEKEIDKDRPMCVVPIKVETSADTEINKNGKQGNLEGTKPKTVIGRRFIRQELSQANIESDRIINCVDIKQEMIEVEIDVQNDKCTENQDLNSDVFWEVPLENDQESQNRIDIQRNGFTDNNEDSKRKESEKKPNIERKTCKGAARDVKRSLVRIQIECPICHRTYINKNSFGLHLKSHTVGHYECDICQRTYTVKHKLQRHVRSHTLKKRFECELCKQRFTEKNHLVVHLRTHTGEKPFECETCQHRFITISHLNKHSKSHTGERPFVCDLCQGRFTAKAHLNAHLRIHTGEKPFQCEICQRRFATGSHLSTHLRTHTGEKPFECEICRRKFTQKSIMSRHVKRIHIAEHRYECVICKETFLRKYTLNTHMRTHTGE